MEETDCSIRGEEAKYFPSTERESRGSRVQEGRRQSCPHVFTEHLPGRFTKRSAVREARACQRCCGVSRENQEGGGRFSLPSDKQRRRDRKLLGWDFPEKNVRKPRPTLELPICRGAARWGAAPWRSRFLCKGPEDDAGPMLPCLALIKVRLRICAPQG